MKAMALASAVIASTFALCGTATAAFDSPRASCSAASADDITQVAVSDPRFSTLCAALQAAGLVDALKSKGPFTVFAPTNDAFAKLPAGTVETLLKPENKARLAAILKYHVLEGEVLAKDVHTMPAPTLLGQRISIVAKDGSVMIDKSKVTQTDIKASNGVIHVIDTVLIPSEKDLVATAVAAGKFTILAQLLEQVDLVGALQSEGPFTVFAPTDDAFRKLPKATLDSLAKPESREKLAAILKYHVVKGRVDSPAAAKGATVPTLEGATITTRTEGKKIMVNNAAVVTPDIQATNGVIHVIDTVLIPK